ncbi:hypothetical protein BH18ACT4_BH18ACT4_06460 [soil metagenome]
MADITMPQLGETVTEGTITKWFKQVGDEIAEDEVLFEVSTDKVDSEVPAPSAGYVAEILVQEGETVDVGTKLAVISDSAPGGDGSDASAETTSDTQPDEPADSDDAPPAKSGADADDAPDDGSESQSGGAPEETEPASAPAPAKAKGAMNGKLLSPVVRRLITEHGLDPAQIPGTGAGGRITRNDVLAIIESDRSQPADGGGATSPAPAPSARAGAPTAEARTPVTAGERDTSVPLSNIRKRTAEHMVRSLQTSAHVYASIEVDYEGIEVVRRAQKEKWKAEEGFGLTYLGFVARAVVDAVRDFPEVNATLSDNELIVHHYVNLGIAVDLDFKGLIVPVVRDADSKRMRAIAREISDLAGRARAKKLAADEIAGGTFTITNPGPFGTLLTMPIINQPQVAILSTDGVRRRPVVVALPDGSEGIASHSVGNLALALDHRAFDGAYASAFLAKVRQIIETRDWSAEL